MRTCSMSGSYTGIIKSCQSNLWRHGETSVEAPLPLELLMHQEVHVTPRQKCALFFLLPLRDTLVFV
jgi:hypothetical protein